METLEPDQIKYLDRTMPEISVEEAEAAAGRLYGLHGTAVPLVSERDRTFRIRTGDGQAYILKILNAAEEPGVIDFQVRALRHLQKMDPELPLPRVVPSVSGQDIVFIKARTGAQHLAHMLTYLPGETAGGLSRPPAFWRDLGGFLGRLDLALRSFFHPNARHELLWDVQRSPALLPLAHHIQDRAARASIEQILIRTRDEILPRIARLRHQVIHADVHADNTIILPEQPERIAGLVDFGDMLYAPLVTEVAIAADLDTVEADSILDCLGSLAAGYDGILPFEEQELEFVYPLILARYAATAAIIAWRRQMTPDQPPYLPLDEQSMWTFIDRFQTIGEQQARRSLARACSFPIPGGSGESGSLLAQRYTRLGAGSPVFYRNPVHIERGEGPWLLSPDGRAYLDAYNNVPVAGHSHPRVVRAIARQAAVLNTNTRYLYRVILDYSERLAGTLPEPLSMCLFVNSGSEANDIAWQIATYATGKRGALVMEGAYHGITEAIRDLSPATEDRPLAPHVQTLENPDPYRGRFRYGEPDLAQKYAADADRAVRMLEAGGSGIAAFMVDSAFVSSGIPDVPEGYLVRVADIVRGAGGLVIADEVQAGFGRSGSHLWGHAAHGILPDIVTLGKPVGNGYPLGVVITTPAILEPFLADTGLFSTFGGNPVACAAGMAVLDVIEEEGLIRNAFETGSDLRAGIREMMDRFEMIGDVRGRGLLVGVELVRDRMTQEPAREETRKVVERMRELGVLIGSEGLHGNVLKIRPPLVFRKTHADQLINALSRALTTF